MLNDWSHKVRAILKNTARQYQKILPSSQSAWNTRFYFGHQKLCMDNNIKYVDANLDAHDNTISGNEPSSEKLTSQSQIPE